MLDADTVHAAALPWQCVPLLHDNGGRFPLHCPPLPPCYHEPAPRGMLPVVGAEKVSSMKAA